MFSNIQRSNISFDTQGSNTDSLSKKSEVSIASSNKSDDSTTETAECEDVQLRNKPVHLAERSSVNQCINELSSNLAAEAARRRCNSEVVQRSESNRDISGKVFDYFKIINVINYICFIKKTLFKLLQL